MPGFLTWVVPSDPFFAKWSRCLEREAGKGKETEVDAGTGLVLLEKEKQEGLVLGWLGN